MNLFLVVPLRISVNFYFLVRKPRLVLELVLHISHYKALIGKNEMWILHRSGLTFFFCLHY